MGGKGAGADNWRQLALARQSGLVRLTLSLQQTQTLVHYRKNFQGLCHRVMHDSARRTMTTVLSGCLGRDVTGLPDRLAGRMTDPVADQGARNIPGEWGGGMRILSDSGPRPSLIRPTMVVSRFSQARNKNGGFVLANPAERALIPSVEAGEFSDRDRRAARGSGTDNRSSRHHRGLSTRLCSGAGAAART